MPVLTVGHVAKRLASGLRLAWTDVWKNRRIAFVSPMFAFPLVYALVYGLGALLYADRMGSRAPVFAFAVGGGLLAYVVATGMTWPKAMSSDAEKPMPPGRWLLLAAVALVTVGLIAMIAYLLAIGGIPLLMPSVEQARVDAAERGGAALRVASLLALPGAWFLAAAAGASRRLLPLVAVGGLVVLVAGLHILTANRAPAFLTVEVAVVAFLLGAGIARMRVTGVALLSALVLGLVVAAGAVGGFRFSATPTTWRDPQIARGVASGDVVALTGEAARNYLIVPIQNFGSTMDAVPALIPWRFGYTYLQSLVTVLPGRQTTFDQDLKEALAQGYAGGGTVPSLLGESYANFGPIGWIVVPAAVGVLLTIAYAFAMSQQTVAGWALYAWILVHMVNATISGIIVANIFPYIAAVILGALGMIMRRRRQPAPPAPD